MILAFESAQQVFGCFFAVPGALLISAVILDWIWHMGRPSPTQDRWLKRLVLVICGIGAIAMGLVVAYS